MKALITTAFLLLSLSVPLVGARTRHAQSQEPVPLKDVEYKKAEKLAVRFMKRLRETDDFGPLVSEFFPTDFAERLKKSGHMWGTNEGDLIPWDKDVLSRADAAEQLRGYVAFVNFWNQQDLIGDAAWDYVKLECRIEGKDATSAPGAWGRHLRLREEAVPAEAFRIAQSDPILAALIGLVRADGTDDNGAGNVDNEEQRPDEDDAALLRAVSIKDLARLRAFIDKMERCAGLLREGAEKLRSDAKTLAAVHGLSVTPERGAARPGEDFRVYHLDSETLEAEAFGLSAGALLIRARIYPYELAMTRADGRIKILAVYPDLDGD
jgi:hypothetical protein